jgi:hypothetical protein
MADLRPPGKALESCLPKAASDCVSDLVQSLIGLGLVLCGKVDGQVERGAKAGKRLLGHIYTIPNAALFV